MAEFDTSSEDEDIENFENLPQNNEFVVDWVNIASLGLCDTLALSALPGCRFREHRRNLQRDIEVISKVGITDVVCLMTPPELIKYRTPTLFGELEKFGIFVHHRPIEDGGIPTPDDLMITISAIRTLVADGRRVLVHCYGGLGRTCLVAGCFLLSLDPYMHPDSAISYLRNLRGPRAVQTVRQWNMMQDFRRIEREFRLNEMTYEDRSRSVSR